MVSAVLAVQQDRGVRISVSALTAGCPRGLVVERMADYIDDLDSLYAALRGTLVHRTLELATREDAIAEARFYTEVDGIEFSGSPDLLTQEAVYDYKVTDSPPGYDYPYRHHTEQVQFNAFVARHMTNFDLPPGLEGLPFDPRDYPVKRAIVVYLGPKGPKVLQTQKMQEFITPAGKTKEGKRPYIWNDEEVLEHEGHLRARLHALVQAFEQWPVFPSGVEEVWGGQPNWTCPGPPLCHLPNCAAKRYPDGLVWEKPE